MSESIKLCVAIPSNGLNPFGFTISGMNLMLWLANGIRSRPNTSLELYVDGQASSVIQSNREMLVRRALDHDCTHLLFLDHDMDFRPQAVDLLFSRRHPVVVCNYLIKAEPPDNPEFVTVALNGRRIITEQSSTGLQEIAYSGFGVSLFETDVFRKTPQPWFESKFVPEAGCYTTEDNPFFEKVRAAGFPCYLDHDASKHVTGHIGNHEWRWQDYRRVEKAAPPATPVNRIEANGKVQELARA